MTRMQLGMASQETLTSHKGIVTWWKFNRVSLEIVVKARAMLYINGQVYAVSFDRKEELAK